MNNNIKKLICSLVFILLAGCTDDFIAQKFNDLNDKTPGCAVGVVKGDNLVYENYFGQSNLRYQVPIDNRTVFNIASISKHITVYLVLLLEKEGKLSRSDTLDKYYPEGPSWFGDITLYQLIHHRSGLPGFFRDSRLNASLVGKLASNNTLMNQLIRGKPVPQRTYIRALIDTIINLESQYSPPGIVTAYSNTGYTMLGDIIEKVSGIPFDDLAEREIFKPLGMHSTKITDENYTEIPWSTTAHYAIDFSKGEFITLAPMISSFGSGGVVTTMPDFAKWVSHLIKPKMNKDIWTTLLNSDDPVFGPSPSWKSKLDQYVNGFIFKHIKGNSIYSHDGYSVDTMTSNFWFSPEMNLGYIQFCNFERGRRVEIFEVFETYGD